MGETTAIESALTADQVAAANGLTRRWFAAREEVPAAASGLGVWPLVCLLAAGASGPTRDELLAAAGVGEAAAGPAASGLVAAARSAPGLDLAIGVWAGARTALDPEWEARLPAGVTGSLTGDPAADRAALDSWAGRNTGGMIERMPVDLAKPIDLLLAGALLVRTTWVTRFRDVPRRFRSGPWSGLGTCKGLEGTVDEDVLRVTDRASVLTVAGRDGIDVLLGLGREDLSPPQVFSALTEAAGDPRWGRSAATELAVGERAPGVAVEEYEDARPQRGPEVRVQAVRFSVSDDLDLLGDAAALGIVRAADRDRSGLDGLAAERVHISQARQSCTAAFSAEGFKAAAVTAFAMRRAGFAPPRAVHRRRRASIEFDRPFAYLARHRPSGLILVGGWVGEPERER